MMVDVGVMTDNDRDAFQEAGLCSCAFSIRACNAEAHHLAAFWKAFFMDIKPIETVYGGNKYRSRLEARWAVFFDQAGIEFDYEPQGFQGDGWKYLPDFFLPDLKCYVEIKPDVVTTRDISRCLSFAIEANTSLVVFIGHSSDLPSGYMFNRRFSVPWDEFIADHKACVLSDRAEGIMRNDSDSQVAVDCLVENGRQVYFGENLSTGLPVLIPSNQSKIRNRLHQAAAFARQSRFEFGQTPAEPCR